MNMKIERIESNPIVKLTFEFSLGVIAYCKRLDAQKDFQPLIWAGSTQNALVINNDRPIYSVRELIDYAKKNPGKLNYASAGNGSAHHLAGELFKMQTKTFLTHIPYRGAGPALADLIAGQVDMLFDGLGSSSQHIKSGKIKALGMFSGKRLQGAPEVPTIQEAGGPALESSTWVMFLAPAGTPPAVVNRLSQETARVVNDTEIRDRFNALGIEVAGYTPEQTGKFLADEIAKWAKVIQTAGVKAEQ